MLINVFFVQTHPTVSLGDYHDFEISQCGASFVRWKRRVRKSNGEKTKYGILMGDDMETREVAVFGRGPYIVVT
jgi:hypothetical protein